MKVQYSQRNSYIYIIYVLFALCLFINPLIQYILGKNNSVSKMMSYYDEFLSTIVFIITFCHKNLFQFKEFKWFLLLLLFYLIYSFGIESNIWEAIVLDALIGLKPFFCFFSAYYMGIHLDVKTSEKCRKIFIVLGIISWIELPFLNAIYPNTSGYYTSCLVVGMSYMFFSNCTKKDFIITALFLLPGLVTLKSKFISEFIAFIFIAFLLKGYLKFNIKSIVALGILIVISIYANFDKFNNYFVYGIANEQARSYLYAYVPQILKEYFPFGSGLGTYGTEAAAKYYSPLYNKFQFYYVFGLSPSDYNTDSDFLKDTFYPVLAQFGIFGIILYVCFWIRRYKESITKNLREYKVFLFIALVMAIQCVADLTFTGPLGNSMMLLIGILCSHYTHIDYIPKVDRGNK